DGWTIMHTEQTPQRVAVPRDRRGESRRRDERARAKAERRGFSVDEIAGRNDLCRESIYKEIRAGRLIARKLGRKTLILIEDETAWRANLPRLTLAEREVA